MNRSFSKVLLAIATTLIAVLGITSMASAVPNRPPVPPPTNFWQNKGFMLMAHQGGEWDYPPNTLFAYKSAIADGADVIDMDAYVTKDGKLVLSHDQDADNNSNAEEVLGSGPHPINTLTVAQLKTLDFAYKWSPHDKSSTTPWRGVASGDVPPPDGFTPNDFKIPTFSEVLAAFPNTPINIELKQVDGVSIEDTVTAMANELASHPGHDSNVLINSFGQEMLDAMHAKRPQHLAYSGSEDALLAYVLHGTPITPTPVAVEPPDLYQLAAPPAAPTATVPLMKPNTDYDGYQIFVWGSDLDPTQDTPPFYANLIAKGADSYNTPDPIALAAYLCTAGIAKPDGSPRCASQKCPAGQTGIAPSNCKDIPPTVCPEGQVGTPPACAIVDPIFNSKVTKVSFGSKKGKIKAGKKSKVILKVSASKATTGPTVKIRLKSSNRNVKVAKTVSVKLKPGSTVKKMVTVTATKKAKGKAKITASSGRLSGSTSLTVKAVRSSQCKKGNKKSSGHFCGTTDHF